MSPRAGEESDGLGRSTLDVGAPARKRPADSRGEAQLEDTGRLRSMCRIGKLGWRVGRVRISGSCRSWRPRWVVMQSLSRFLPRIFGSVEVTRGWFERTGCD